METKSDEPAVSKVTIVVFSADMDRVMAALNIAVGAASMGMQATMFFTFWGLNVLKRRNASPGARGFIRSMLSMMSPRGANNLPLSRLNMLGLGPLMMKNLMKQFRMPGVEQMISLAKQNGVRLIACTVTMELMGIGKEKLIDGIDSFAGVATYLSEANQANVNLFV